MTAHGPVETPVFMAVGTRATVTGLDPGDLAALGAQVVLANTYHLMLRPGPELFRRVGGIHTFMGWPGPVLTDSGGYQIFSLPGDRTITEKGARFRSYVDSRMHMLSPERSIEMQTAIGSDIMMVLDECIDSTSDEAATRAAMERTHRWALRSLAARTQPGAGAVRDRAGRRGPRAAPRVGGVPDRAPVRRLRDRRPRRGRHARRARGHDRACRRAACRPIARAT